jgi:hypothetical protein
VSGAFATNSGLDLQCFQVKPGGSAKQTVGWQYQKSKGLGARYTAVHFYTARNEGVFFTPKGIY